MQSRGGQLQYSSRARSWFRSGGPARGIRSESQRQPRPRAGQKPWHIIIEDLGNFLDFEIMVPRAQCPHLVALAALGFAGDVFGRQPLERIRAPRFDSGPLKSRIPDRRPITLRQGASHQFHRPPDRTTRPHQVPLDVARQGIGEPLLRELNIGDL